MMHPLDRPVPSDLSFEALQKRLRTRQLHTPELNEANRRRFGMVQLVVREAVAGDQIVAVSEEAWRRLQVERRQSRLA